MPICSNPEQRRIRVNVGSSVVILTTRNYSFGEFEKFMKARFKVKNRGKVDDKCTEERLKFIDSILTGIASENEDGNPDTVTYVDPVTKEEKELNPSVENWVSFVNPSWKASAAIALEESNAEVEADTLKN